MNRFPGRTGNANEPNFANEYSIGAFGYGGGGGGSQQQQQQQQHVQQPKERTFAPQEQQQQQQQFQPQAANQAPYSYSYGGYGQYASVAYQQQQQQAVMGHVGLQHSHHQQQQQQQQHGGAQHQGYGADPLGMLVSSATQPDAMPQQQQQQHQQHDLTKNAGAPKYRGAFGMTTPQDAGAYLSGGGGGSQGLQSYADRQQDSFIKYAQSTVQQQQQHQQQHMAAIDVANPHQGTFRTQLMPPSSYGAATGAVGGGSGGSYPFRAQASGLDLVSPTAAVAAAVAMSTSSGYDPSNLNTGSLQRMNNGYSLGSSGSNIGGSSRVPNLFPGSAAALTSRLKNEGGGDLIDPRVPASLGYDQQQQQQQQVSSTSAMSKGFGGGSSIYVDSSATNLSSNAAGGNNNSGGGGMYPAPLHSQEEDDNPPSGEVCSLCLGSNPCDRIAHGCGHLFHSSCLQDWGDKLACPMCRPAATHQITSRVVHGGSNIASFGVGGGATNSNNNVSQLVDAQAHQPVSASSGSLQQMQQLQAKKARASSASASLGGPNSSSNQMVTTRPPPIDTRLPEVVNKSPASSTGVTPTRSSSTTSSSGSSRARKNKKLKDCSVPGCDRTVRSRGLCKGHGGGRRCGFAGCGLSDQGGGYCISHGGGKRCQYEGCDNSAQSRGLCKLHGGGSRCTVANCTKSSQGRGLCRAHGGGRRCMIEGCNKTDRRAGYCVTHGADKKCIVAECSKTGRIDNMCTKHYFERNQPFQRSGAAGGAAGAGAAESYDFDDDEDDDDDDDEAVESGSSSIGGAKSRKKLVATTASRNDSTMAENSNAKRLKQNDYRGGTAGLKNGVAAMDLSKSQQF